MTQQLNLFDAMGMHEGLDIELKSAKGGLPKSLWETYSAFANTAGGVIYLGIKERPGGGLEYHGVENSQKLLQDFWNTVNNPQRVSINILTDANVTVETIGDVDVVVIEVPRATREQRPVYIGVDPHKGSYRRNNEGDFLCNSGEVQRMFADRQDDEPVDSQILGHFGLDDLDETSLRQFRNRMASRSPNHPWLSEDDLGLLRKLGGWRKDRKTGQDGLTLAGLLMFGKTDAITDTAALPGFHLDYRERLSDDEDVRWSDRLTIDGTWEANLFQFYQRVVQKIGSDSALKSPFQRDEAGYRKGQTPLHEALQEALVNALIHADHSGQGGIVIDRYMDHFEFSNPGTLLLSIDQLLTGGVSECRNKSLQKMFQHLGAGDKAGSGLDKIRRSWRARHWQSPSLRETLRPDRVTLVLPLISMLPEGVVDALKERFGEDFSTLTEDEVQALVTAAGEGRVTNQRLQEMLTRHRVDITQMLRGLVERQMLEAHGQGRGTYYSIVGFEEAEPGSSPHKSISSPHKDEGSPHKITSSPHKDEGSPHKITSSPHKDEGSPHSAANENWADIRTDDWTELRLIALPVAEQGRASPEALQAVILRLCQQRYLTLRELSELLQRDAKSLQGRHIGPLVQQGRLALRYPDKRNHSQQSYRTVEGASE